MRLVLARMVGLAQAMMCLACDQHVSIYERHLIMVMCKRSHHHRSWPKRVGMGPVAAEGANALRAAAGSVHTACSTLGGSSAAEWCGFGDAEDEFFLRALPDDAFCGERVTLVLGQAGITPLALTHSGECFLGAQPCWTTRLCQSHVGGCLCVEQRIGVRVQNVHTCTGAGAEAEAGSPARTIGDAPAGHGAELERRPVRVQSMSARGVVALSAGGGIPAAVTASGGLWLCGRNCGQLGMGDPVWFPKMREGILPSSGK